MLPPYMTIVEAAKALTISRSHLNRLLKDKRIGAVKIGRRTVIPSTAIETFIASVKAQASPDPAIEN